MVKKIMLPQSNQWNIAKRIFVSFYQCSFKEWNYLGTQHMGCDNSSRSLYTLSSVTLSHCVEVLCWSFNPLLPLRLMVINRTKKIFAYIFKIICLSLKILLKSLQLLLMTQKLGGRNPLNKILINVEVIKYKMKICYFFLLLKTKNRILLWTILFNFF